jgi:LysM repeat protein
LKALIIIVLTIVIFGGAAYSTYLLYVKPREELKQAKALGPVPPPPDPTLGEYQKRLQAQESQTLLEARASWTEFIERYPESTKLDEAKNFLGRLNAAIFLSPIESPEKQVYLVKSGDVITRVAGKMKTTPELLMRSNNLTGSMLKIGQKLIIAESDFSLTIQRRQQRVVLFNNNRFFKQYSILGMPKAATNTSGKATPRPAKVTGKVADRIAWHNGQRITFTDKEYPHADHWIVVSPGGHTLYNDQPTTPGTTPPQRPPGGGYVLAPEDLREIAALVKKSDLVTID